MTSAEGATAPDPDQVVGCLMGGALGDGLGSSYEGKPGPILVDPKCELRITDDTWLSLATAEAIEAGGRITPEGLAEVLVEGYRRRRFPGLGASTLKALRDLDLGAHWALSGRRGEMAAGNGAAMRVAPLAFCIDPDQPEQRTLLSDLCRITHHSDEAYAGALAILVAIRTVLWGTWSPGECLTRKVAEALPDTNVRDGLLALGELPVHGSLREAAGIVGCGGAAAQSVPLAIYGAQQVGALEFEALLTAVVEVGGDTDTNASMTGQIAGAGLGWSRLPKDLSARLPMGNRVLEGASALSERLVGRC